MESIKNQIANEYLHSLLLKHSHSMSKTNEFVLEVNNNYEKMIQQGIYDIRPNPKINNSKSMSNMRKKKLEEYANSKKYLEEQIQILQRSLENQNDQDINPIVSDAERLRFLSQIKKQKNILDKKRQQNAIQMQLKQRLKETEQKEKKQREAIQKKQQRRKQIEQKLSQLSEAKYRRGLQIKTRNREYQSVARQKTLVQKMQQEFNMLQNYSLEQKKKKLAKIRQFHKPISKDEFQEHAERIREFKEIKEQEKSHSEQKRQVLTNRYYKSHWYKTVQKQEKIDQDKQIQEQKQIVKQLKDNQKKYAEYIRQNFVPEPDEKKIEQLIKRQNVPIIRKKPKQIRQMGLNNLKFSKQMIASKQQLEEEPSAKRTHQAIAEKPKDYLEQLNRNKKSTSLQQNFFENIKRKTISELEKNLKIKEYAQKLEEKAKKREQLRKIKKSVVDQQLDDLYIKALNAKLKLLDKK